MKTLAIGATLMALAVTLKAAVPGLAMLIAPLAIWQVASFVGKAMAEARRRRLAVASLRRLAEADRGYHHVVRHSLTDSPCFDDSQMCPKPASSSLTMTQSFAA